MSRKSNGHGTLADRVAATRAAEAERSAGQHGTAAFHGNRPTAWADVLRDVEPPPAAEALAPPDYKHCWYDGPHGRQAALLLEWRALDGYYHGRIAVAALEPDGWGIVEMWVEQGMLSPA
ncbi:hypothetical protein [Nocardioides sp. SYSU D00065]|uniref:hypothetical protein n=1 Tax=Nocardioides sp. SYSU D00065 TaxID=2817378 RepID=UPI001B31ADB0|nr:hypothetical protein [Nocardioides sp. SYSU D00065]